VTHNARKFIIVKKEETKQEGAGAQMLPSPKAKSIKTIAEILASADDDSGDSSTVGQHNDVDNEPRKSSQHEAAPVYLCQGGRETLDRRRE
jgi:hypothetical protein